MLNFQLYSSLKSAFNDVKICNQNQNAQISNRKISNWGECYVVSCPFCKRDYDYIDRRGHLYVGHLYGIKIGNNNLNLVKCHRHDCLKKSENKKIFDQILFRNGYRPSSASILDLYSEKLVFDLDYDDEELNDDISSFVSSKWPDDVIYFKDLIENCSECEEYVSYQYLIKKFKTKERVKEISEKFNLGLVVYSKRIDEVGGLFIPYFIKSKNDETLLFSYQVRCFSHSEISSKYLSGENIHKVFYNQDKVNEGEDLYIVEGASDVWRMYLIGKTNTVAISGHSFSHHQTNFINSVNPSSITLFLDKDVKRDELFKIFKNFKNFCSIDISKIYIIDLNNSEFTNANDPCDIIDDDELKKVLEKGKKRISEF